MKRMTIVGNVGHDAELRVSQSGRQFATFSVAVSMGNKSNPKTDWVDVSCNGKLAEVAYMRVKKGRRVLVDGYPSVGAYISRTNIPVGVLRLYAHSLEILANSDISKEVPNTDNLLVDSEDSCSDAPF